ncbi:MAG: glycosyltransferase family 39 protein [Chloroflexales bacterium]|nr:glycosyltransferase family 39 protein [Chloroflexales bacterium]
MQAATVTRTFRRLYYPAVRSDRLLLAISFLLLAGALVLSAVWQWHGRTHQHLDIGGPLDDGYALFFYAPETTPGNVKTSYRWSQPESEIRLWSPPPGTPVRLTLQMLAPAQLDRPQRVALSIGAEHLADVILTPEFRRYQVLFNAPELSSEGDIAIRLEAPRLAVGDDPRSLGVALDQVTLEAMRGPSLADLLREFWSIPFLQLGLLLLAVCALLLRLPSIYIGGIPALSFAMLTLLARLIPDARMVLALYLVALAVVVAAALALVALVRRAPQIWPQNDCRARFWLLAIFIGSLVLTFAPTIQSDGTGYYAYLRSFTMDSDLQFGNEYRDAPFLHSPDPSLPRDTPTGHQANHFAVGPAIVWSPLYGIAHLFVLGAQAMGAPWQADGYDQPYVVLSIFTSALAGLVTLLVTYQICRRWVGPPTALLAATTLFLGSNLLFYAMREGSFAHSLSAMAASLYVLAWLRLEERPSIGRWALVGAAAGAMLLMYWLSVLVLILPVFTFGRLMVAALRGSSDQRGQQLAGLFAGGAVAALILGLVFSPQLMVWYILYGTVITIPQGAEYVRPRVFHGIAFLFSHLRGMLPWSPAFFLGMIGLTLLWRRTRWLTVGLVAAFALYFWYNASHWQWYAGGAFGPRRMTVLTPWYAIGLALLFDAARRWRADLPVLLAALMAGWMTLLALRYQLALFPRDPGQLEQMPALSFYFSLEAIPLWAAPGWISSSFIPSQLHAFFSAAPANTLAPLIVIMGLATWGVFAVFQWLTQPERTM